MLRNQPEYKWLDISKLAHQVLAPDNQLLKVRYFTARVSARVDQDAPARQQIYLDALSTSSEIEVHFGKFLVTKTWAGLVPPDLDPAKIKAKPPFMPWPSVVRVYKTEEKGSDVNLATHLLHDAFRDQFDVAAVITNDSDLTEAIRIVKEEMGKIVGILSPVPKPSTSLTGAASFVRHIREQHLASSQFPDEIVLDNGKKTITRPDTWTATVS